MVKVGHRAGDQSQDTGFQKQMGVGAEPASCQIESHVGKQPPNDLSKLAPCFCAEEPASLIWYSQPYSVRLRLALWSDSVNERMGMVDRVWRDITEPVMAPVNAPEHHLIQILRVGTNWEFQIYLSGDTTQAIPPGGEASWRIQHPEGVEVLQMDTAAIS